MNMLESPLEALAFDYVSFGIFGVVNNIWTWVAVVTAAVSFWKIKAQVKPALLQHRNDRNPSGSQQPVPEMPPAEESSARVALAASASPATASPSVGDVDGVTKGKFTLYYREEKEEVDGEITAVEELWEDNSRGGDWWERMTRVRRAELGWYSYQDLTVVNGNIVRLWDECKIREKRSCCGRELVRINEYKCC